MDKEEHIQYKDGDECLLVYTFVHFGISFFLPGISAKFYVFADVV